jgi:hypothetical protein
LPSILEDAALHENIFCASLELNAVRLGKTPSSCEGTIFHSSIMTAHHVYSGATPALKMASANDKVIDSRHLQGIVISLRSGLQDVYIFQDYICGRGLKGTAIINIDAVCRKALHLYISKGDITAIGKMERLLATFKNRRIVGINSLDYNRQSVFARNVAQVNAP